MGMEEDKYFPTFTFFAPCMNLRSLYVILNADPYNVPLQGPDGSLAADSWRTEAMSFLRCFLSYLMLEKLTAGQ